MNNKTAFIFDMNGTMIDDMSFHITTWYDYLNNMLSAGLTREQVKSHMYGKNEEVLERIFGKGRFTREEMYHHSMEKEKQYQQIYLPHLKLINGLDQFLDNANQLGTPMAIGTAAIPFNVNFILDNLDIRKYFNVIVTADDVALSKPHPETFLKAAECMNITPEHCIVFEDSPKGVEAAKNAGMQAIVVLSIHEEKDFKAYNNISKFIHNYAHIKPDDFFLRRQIV